MAKFLLHSLFLVAAVIVAFLWTSHPTLSVYTLQFIALFVLFFFLNQFITRRRRKKINLTIDAVVFTMVTLLLIISTGGLTSPLFFLIYFLMFGLALLFEPMITLVIAATMIIFFFITPTKEEPLTELLQLFSLILITPIALFFGKQYLRLLEDEEKVKILKQESKIMEKQIEKEETDVLMWTNLDLKQGLSMILEQTSDLLADVGHLTLKQKEKLGKIRQTASEIIKTSQDLKKEVDQTTDED